MAIAIVNKRQNNQKKTWKDFVKTIRIPANQSFSGFILTTLSTIIEITYLFQTKTNAQVKNINNIFQ